MQKRVFTWAALEPSSASAFCRKFPSLLSGDVAGVAWGADDALQTGKLLSKCLATDTVRLVLTAP